MLKSRYLGPVVLGIVAIAAPFALWNNFLKDLLVLAMIYAIMALSLNVVVGYMGEMSFGHQAFFGIGAYTSALLSTRTGVSPWLDTLAGVAVGGLFGLIIGLVALRAMRGTSLAIVTFGAGAIIWQIALNEFDITGGARGISGVRRLALPGLVFNTEVSLYFLLLACVALTVYFLIRWERSRFGRAVIAIRENEELAKSVGINSYLYLVLTFGIAAALAALAGSLYAHYLTVVNPYLFGTYYLLGMIIMVIVGGKGTLGGPILGAFIFSYVINLLPTSRDIDLVIFGGILLAIILLAPQGAYPFLKSLVVRVTERMRQENKNG